MILGVHVTKSSHVLDDKSHAKDLSDAINRDTNKLKINAVQIFTYGPQYIIPNKIDYNLISKVTSDIDLTVHSAYASTAIWKVSSENKHTHYAKKQLDLFKAQLLSCMKISAWGLVLHVTKQYSDILADTMTLLKPLSKRSGVKIILEMVANKPDPDKTYETPEKINNLTTLIGPNEQWWGWCVDTAHLWGAGVDVRSYDAVKDWIERIAYKKKIVQFHLNGSSAAKGSGKDKHEIAFGPDDLIWNGIDPEKSGVKAIVEFAVANQITIICEINRGSEANVIKSLATIKKLGRM